MELRTELVELLKQLNRAEMEEDGDVAGLETDELRHSLARSPVTGLSVDEVAAALRVLVGNGLARELCDPEYAWNRGRVVAERFTITPAGKEFLLRQIQRIGRV
jgi:hypothetical protein